MKRKVLTLLFAMCLVVSCMFILTACKKKNEEPTLTSVTAEVGGGYTEYYNESNKTFTVPYATSFSLSEYSFSLTENYSNGNVQSVDVANCTYSIPSELMTGENLALGTYTVSVSYNGYSFTYYVVVVEQQITKPTVLTESVYTYDTFTQYLTPSWFDDDKMTISGNVQTNAGTYDVVVSLKTGYIWDDGTSSPITFEWVINKKVVEIPNYTNNQTFRYDSGYKCPSFDYSSTGEFSYVNEDGESFFQETEIGDYTAYIKLADVNNYQWSTGSSDDLLLNWSIIIGQLTKPTLISNSMVLEYVTNTYEANEQNIANFFFVEGYYEGHPDISVSGNKQTGVGDYVVNFDIINKDLYEWEDGTNTTVSYDWHITKANLDCGLPYLSTAQHEYDGDPVDITIEAVYDNYLFESPTGDLTATNVKVDGNYRITFKLKDGLANNFNFSFGNITEAVLEWNIYPKSIDRPNIYSDGTTKVYNGSEQTFTFWEALSGYYNITDNKQTVVGNYTAKIYLADTLNYKWQEDGKASTDYYEFDYKMIPMPVDMPRIKEYSKLTYNGSEQSLINILENYDADLMDITGHTATDASKDNKAVVTLKDDDNYSWPYYNNLDNIDSSPLTITWTLHQMVINPEILNKDDYYYTGEEQTVQLGGLGHFVGDFADCLTISDNITQIEPKMYTIIVTLNSENYKWATGTVGQDNERWLYWTIQKRLIEKPTADLSYNEFKFEYSGRDCRYSPEGFDDTYMTIADNVKTEAGSYTTTVSIKDNVHDQWADKTTSPVTFDWVIKSKVVTKPTAPSVDFVYDGTVKTYALVGADENLVTIQYTSARDAGQYQCVVSLKNPGVLSRNYVWADDTPDDLSDNPTSALTFDWEIKKAVLTITNPFEWSAWTDCYYDNNTPPELPYLVNAEYDTEKIYIFYSLYINGDYKGDYQGDGRPVESEGYYQLKAYYFIIGEENQKNYRLPTVEEGAPSADWSYTTEILTVYTSSMSGSYKDAQYFSCGMDEPTLAYTGDAVDITFDLDAYIAQKEGEGYILIKADFNLTYAYWILDPTTGDWVEKLDGPPSEVGRYAVEVNFGNENLYSPPGISCYFYIGEVE